jgi:hypothetical protein
MQAHESETHWRGIVDRIKAVNALPAGTISQPAGQLGAHCPIVASRPRQ